MNLNDYLNYVWAQTDTTSADLPALTIQNYVDEGFQRTIAAENRWPFYEQQWELTLPMGKSTITLPPDVNPPAIMSLVDTTQGGKLQQINQEEAESRWTAKTIQSDGLPWAYSIWARTLFMWPRYERSSDTKFIMRGYRQPLVTFKPDSGEIDCDPRLHKGIAHYAVSLAYAQQEDDVLEDRYMKRWQHDVEMARKALMDPPGDRPLVMYGNYRRRRGVPNSHVIGGGGNWGSGGDNHATISPPAGD